MLSPLLFRSFHAMSTRQKCHVVDSRTRLRLSFTSTSTYLPLSLYHCKLYIHLFAFQAISRDVNTLEASLSWQQSATVDMRALRLTRRDRVVRRREVTFGVEIKAVIQVMADDWVSILNERHVTSTCFDHVNVKPTSFYRSSFSPENYVGPMAISFSFYCTMFVCTIWCDTFCLKSKVRNLTRLEESLLTVNFVSCDRAFE